ncbi:MAG: HXXEE domain-containing protein [Betaproteobacteria bacterium]
MTRRQIALLVPILLTLHNVEEAMTFGPWLPLVQARAPVLLQLWINEVSLKGLPMALVVATAVPWAVAVWAASRPSYGIAIWSLLLVQAVVLVNVFWHLGAAVVLQGYAPGLLTAVMFNLPFSVYLFRRAVRDRWCSTHALIGLVPAALVVHGPLLMGLVYLMGRIR